MTSLPQMSVRAGSVSAMVLTDDGPLKILPTIDIWMVVLCDCKHA